MVVMRSIPPRITLKQTVSAPIGEELMRLTTGYAPGVWLTSELASLDGAVVAAARRGRP